MRVHNFKESLQKDMSQFEGQYLKKAIKLQRSLKLEAYGCVLNFLLDKQPENEEMITWTKRKIKKIEEITKESLTDLKGEQNERYN